MENILKKIILKYYNSDTSDFDCNNKNDKTVKYLPHQLRVKDFFIDIDKLNQNGILLYHGLGSGKTMTSIISSISYISKKINKSSKNQQSIVVLTPASLKENYKSEILKSKNDLKNFKILSYNTSAIIENLEDTNLDNKIIIVDECHNLASMMATNSKIGKFLYKKLLDAKNAKFLFLSGTPILNTPYEISLLFTILRHNVFFNRNYYTKEEFEDIYVLNERYHSDFRYLINGLTSYFPGIRSEKIFPKSYEVDFHIPMSKLQYIEYKKYQRIENQHLYNKKTLNSKDLKELYKNNQNKYKIYTRQLCNIAHITNLDKISDSNLRFKLNEISPKYYKLVNTIKKSKGPVLVYSNFKETGIDVIARILEQFNINSVMWSGTETEKERKKSLDLFNSEENQSGNKIKCLLITAAGAEGISLKNVRQVHIMEPHWNNNRAEQVIGRAMRLCSHINLDKSQRNVAIYKYYITLPNKNSKSTDVVIKGIADKKSIIINKFLNLIIQSSFDCIFNKDYDISKCLFKIN